MQGLGEQAGNGSSPAAMEGQNLLFIVGHYKSGSTWLLNLLSLHPWVRGVNETHVFYHSVHAANLSQCTRVLYSAVPWSDGGVRNLARHRLLGYARPLLRHWRPGWALGEESRPSSLLDLSLADQLRLRRELLGAASPQDYCRRFFSFLQSRLRPRRYLLEKTPENILCVDTIRSIFPQCRLAAIYRDGRDVVVSDMFFNSGYGHSGRWSFDDSTLKWRGAMEAQLRAAQDHGIAAVSYEALLGDGPQAVRRLLQQLELPADEATVADLLDRSGFRFRTGREPGQEDRHSFNRKGVTGDWRNHFSEEHRRRFKELAGDMLVTLGYEKDTDW